jgi:hypothetical protein
MRALATEVIAFAVDADMVQAMRMAHCDGTPIWIFAPVNVPEATEGDGVDIFRHSKLAPH